MYIFILFLIVLLIIIFLVYKFFPKLDAFLKQYLKSQRVINIKTEMKHLDNKYLKKNNESQNNESKNDQSQNNKSKIQNIFEKVNNIPFMLIDYLNKIFHTFFPSLGK